MLLKSNVDLKLDDQKEKISLLFDVIITKFNIKNEGLLKNIEAEKHKAIKGLDNVKIELFVMRKRVMR